MSEELKKKEQKFNKEKEIQMGARETKKGVSRREFLKGATVGAGVAGLAGLGAMEAKAQPLPTKWDKEADVIVVGSGGAGFAAAATAAVVRPSSAEAQHWDDNTASKFLGSLIDK